MIARLEWVLNFGDDESFPSQIVRGLENEYNLNHDVKNFVRDDVIKSVSHKTFRFRGPARNLTKVHGSDGNPNQSTPGAGHDTEPAGTIQSVQIR